jgi:predicted RNA binding protein YcfA (HicA-like mRNA interferase family)
MPAKVGFVVSTLERNGWVLVRQRGSHRQFKHHDNPYVVTVAGRPSSTLATGTLADIRRKTGLKEIR